MVGTYNTLLVLLSIVVAIFVSYTALSLSARLARAKDGGNASAWVAGGAIAMGGGICAMHYSGMAAIDVVPMITYEPVLLATSVAIAVGASFAALWLFFKLREGQSRTMRLVRVGASVFLLLDARRDSASRERPAGAEHSL